MHLVRWAFWWWLTWRSADSPQKGQSWSVIFIAHVIYQCVLAAQANPILLKEVWIGVLMANPRLRCMREQLAFNAKFWKANL